MAIRKYALTKQDLIDNGYLIEGEKVFKQSSNNVREIKQHTVVGKHKYGKDREYICVSLRIERLDKGHERRLFGLHNVIYAWYKGELPLGYDVDHIDNNPLNNNIDNLELVTHEENLKRRRIKGPNQWYYIKGYDEESWAKRQQELEDIKNNRKLRKELKPKYDLYMKNLKAYIKKAKDLDDFYTWYVLAHTKITFGEFVRRYKESL